MLRSSYLWHILNKSDECLAVPSRPQERYVLIHLDAGDLNEEDSEDEEPFAQDQNYRPHHELLLFLGVFAISIDEDLCELDGADKESV